MSKSESKTQNYAFAHVLVQEFLSVEDTSKTIVWTQEEGRESSTN